MPTFIEALAFAFIVIAAGTIAFALGITPPIAVLLILWQPLSLLLLLLHCSTILGFDLLCSSLCFFALLGVALPWHLSLLLYCVNGEGGICCIGLFVCRVSECLRRQERTPLKK